MSKYFPFSVGSVRLAFLLLDAEHEKLFGRKASRQQRWKAFHIHFSVLLATIIIITCSHLPLHSTQQQQQQYGTYRSL